MALLEGVHSLVKEDFTWMKLNHYVVKFMKAYREQVASKGKKVIVFGKYLDELCLNPPCQAEIFWFENSYKRLWVFLFSKRCLDMKVKVHKAVWQDIDEIILELDSEYPDLNLKLAELIRTLEHFKEPHVQKLEYSWDVFENIYLIYFPRDPRLGTLSIMQYFNESSPEFAAEMVFNLLYTQTMDRYATGCLTF